MHLLCLSIHVFLEKVIFFFCKADSDVSMTNVKQQQLEMLHSVESLPVSISGIKVQVLLSGCELNYSMLQTLLL